MLPHFFIRCDGKFIRVDTREIRYLEAMKNYVKIVTGSKSYLVLISLRQLEQELPADQFCRVHRSYIVSLAHIQSFDQDTVYLEEGMIPINPHYKQALQKRVKLLISDYTTLKKSD